MVSLPQIFFCCNENLINNVIVLYFLFLSYVVIASKIKSDTILKIPFKDIVLNFFCDNFGSYNIVIFDIVFVYSRFNIVAFFTDTEIDTLKSFLKKFKIKSSIYKCIGLR